MFSSIPGLYKLDARVENTRNFSRHGRVPQGGAQSPSGENSCFKPFTLISLHFVFCVFVLSSQDIMALI